MWRATVLTLFPEMFPGPLGMSLAGKALAAGVWAIETVDIRAHATDKHRTVDDTPAGGGPGMVMKPDVLARALDAVPGGRPRLLMSPRGRPLTQSRIQALVREPGVVIVCGRFEGIDQRAIEARELEEVSVGDYVLSGGEIAAMALIDACVRVLPGVMGKEASGVEESFSAGLLEYPHYTRPQVFEGRSIPDVLTCGDHAKVEAWRQDEAERLTRDRRPDLWAAYLTRMQTLPDQTGTRTADTHAIVMVDDRGVIQSWNAGAQALFGYPAVAAVGQTLDVIVPPKYRERHWAGFHAAIKSGKAQSENTPSKVPVLCRDGSVAAFPVRFILLRDPLGQAVAAVAIFARSGNTGA